MFELSEEALAAGRTIAVKLFDVGAGHKRPVVYYACALDPGEGSTSVVRALAESTARHGDTRLLVVDGDGRGRELSRQLGHADAGPEPIETGRRNVSLLAPVEPGEGMALQALAQALTRHAASFDAVIVDGTPLSDQPDLAAIKGAIDGVLLVLESERHRSEVVTATINELRASGVPVAGTILNKKTKYIPEWIYAWL